MAFTKEIVCTTVLRIARVPGFDFAYKLGLTAQAIPSP